MITVFPAVPEWITNAKVVCGCADVGSTPGQKMKALCASDRVVARFSIAVGKKPERSYYIDCEGEKVWRFKYNNVMSWSLYEDGFVMFYDFQSAILMRRLSSGASVAGAKVVA